MKKTICSILTLLSFFLVLTTTITNAGHATAEETGVPLLIIDDLLQDTDSIKTFRAKNPGLPIITRSSSLSPSDLLTQIQTGTADADIYSLVMEIEVLKMGRDGYFVDLSGSEKITDAISRMYPQLQKLVKSDGKLYAYPIAPFVYFWSARTDLLNKYGLTIPATYSEYIDMYVDWYESDMPENTEILFSRDFGVRVDLLLEAINYYEETYVSPERPLSFNNKTLKEIFEKILSLPPSLYEEDLNNERPIVYSDENILFETWNTSPLSAQSSFTGDEEFELFLPPPFEAGGEQFLPANLYVFVVNPLSKNQELAVSFLENLTENAFALYRYLSRTDLMEPVVFPMMDAHEKAIRNTLAGYKTQLESAPSEDQGGIRDEIASLEAELRYVQGNKWLVNAESLAFYREMAPLMRINAHSQVRFAYEELRSILIQMLNGRLSVDEAILQMDHKMEMVFLEQE